MIFLKIDRHSIYTGPEDQGLKSSVRGHSFQTVLWSCLKGVSSCRGVQVATLVLVRLVGPLVTEEM